MNMTDGRWRNVSRSCAKSVGREKSVELSVYRPRGFDLPPRRLQAVCNGLVEGECREQSAPYSRIHQRVRGSECICPLRSTRTRGSGK